MPVARLPKRAKNLNPAVGQASCLSPYEPLFQQWSQVYTPPILQQFADDLRTIKVSCKKRKLLAIEIQEKAQNTAVVFNPETQRAVYSPVVGIGAVFINRLKCLFTFGSIVLAQPQ